MHLRAEQTMLAAVDAYIAATDPAMTRPEAIRRLIQFALEVKARKEQAAGD